MIISIYTLYTITGAVIFFFTRHPTAHLGESDGHRRPGERHLSVLTLSSSFVQLAANHRLLQLCRLPVSQSQTALVVRLPITDGTSRPLANDRLWQGDEHTHVCYQLTLLHSISKLTKDLG